MNETLLLALVGLGALAFIAYLYEANVKHRRAQALAAFASRNDLTYHAAGLMDILSSPFRLFAQGDSRGVENVLTGVWRELPVTVFDFWYSQTRPVGKGVGRTYYHFSCVVAQIDAACPGLAIAREDLASRVADGLGFQDIQLEFDAFNRAFDVSGDRSFAIAFLDGAMMQWLLANGSTHSFETAGNKLLIASAQIEADALPSLLDTMRDFRTRVPRVVFSLYPREAG